MSDIKTYWYVRSYRHDMALVYLTYEDQWSIDPLEAFLCDSYEMAENSAKSVDAKVFEIVAHRSYN